MNGKNGGKGVRHIEVRRLASYFSGEWGLCGTTPIRLTRHRNKENYYASSISQIILSFSITTLTVNEVSIISQSFTSFTVLGRSTQNGTRCLHHPITRDYRSHPLSHSQIT